jgi:hypothetical protein
MHADSSLRAVRLYVLPTKVIKWTHCGSNGKFLNWGEGALKRSCYEELREKDIMVKKY